MPSLIAPVTLRSVTLRNRIVVPPMCQYSAEAGIAQPWHLVQYGRFAVGGAGLVILEATAVLPEGRITHGDLGIWTEAHAAALAPIAAFLKSQGCIPGLQLGHAGRKASMQRPWYGNGPLNAADHARGDLPWGIVAPSAIALDDGYMVPQALDEAGIERLIEAFATGARRAAGAGFEMVEIHMAHGYLLASFLSPLSNRRNDAHGGDAAGRQRVPLAVAQAVRAAFPADKPVFVRISAVDGAEGGVTLEDQIGFARALKAIGIDVVDCSSGGIAGSATAARGPRRDYGFQVPYARAIRAEAGIATMAVGLIVDPRQAQQVLDDGSADLIAVGRQCLEDPNWPQRAQAMLSGATPWADWPKQHGWWLAQRAGTLERLGPWQAA
jgi:2,4-dienoyl-CoA reductase-like NADH-dependent reductase (Old Yellow Enzyme family)